ncbi:hypothetical protein [Rhodopirellula bahusiensis]|uniref:hypothetical protein n=1 Tax=Rhodopirellula bahusiensis TaxID=2014065 RepID=UPI003263B2A5
MDRPSQTQPKLVLFRDVVVSVIGNADLRRCATILLAAIEPLLVPAVLHLFTARNFLWRVYNTACDLVALATQNTREMADRTLVVVRLPAGDIYHQYFSGDVWFDWFCPRQSN